MYLSSFCYPYFLKYHIHKVCNLCGLALSLLVQFRLLYTVFLLANVYHYSRKKVPAPLFLMGEFQTLETWHEY